MDNVNYDENATAASRISDAQESQLGRPENPIDYQETGGIDPRWAPTGLETMERRMPVYGTDAKLYGEYTPYITDLNGRDAAAARNQSAATKIGRGLYRGFVGEILGGTLEGFGALGMLASSEENLLYEIGKGIREGATEDAPIFRANQDTFAWNDAGWWAENIPSIMSTISMMIPGAAAAKGAGLVGRGLAMAGKAGKIVKTAQQADRVQQVARLAGGAYGMRHAENIREAVDVSQQAERDFIENMKGRSLDSYKDSMAWSQFRKDNGRSPQNAYELAKYIGGQAAVRSYQVNLHNLVFDAFQMGVAMKAARNLTRGRTIADKTIKKAGKAAKGLEPDRASRFINAVKKPAVFLGSSLSEGVEEAVNFIGNAEGLYHAQRLQDHKNSLPDKSLGERLSDYMDDDHLYESAFWGSLGGMAFAGLGSRAFRQQQNAQLQSFLAQQEQLEKDAAALKKAREEGDEAAVEVIKNRMLKNLGTRAAVSGRVDKLLEQLNSDEFLDGLLGDAAGDPEARKKMREEAIAKILQSEKDYTAVINTAREHGLSQRETAVLLGARNEAQDNVDNLTSRLEALSEKGPVPEDHKLAFKQVYLEMLKAERSKDGPNKALLDDAIAALEEDLKDKEIPEVAFGELTDTTMQTVMAETALAVNKKALADLETENGLEKIREAAKELEKKDEARARKREQEAVENETDQHRLEKMRNKAKRNGETELVRAIDRRLAKLRKDAKTNEDRKDKYTQGVAPEETTGTQEAPEGTTTTQEAPEGTTTTQEAPDAVPVEEDEAPETAGETTEEAPETVTQDTQTAPDDGQLSLDFGMSPEEEQKLLESTVLNLYLSLGRNYGNGKDQHFEKHLYELVEKGILTETEAKKLAQDAFDTIMAFIEKKAPFKKMVQMLGTQGVSITEKQEKALRIFYDHMVDGTLQLTDTQLNAVRNTFINHQLPLETVQDSSPESSASPQEMTAQVVMLELIAAFSSAMEQGSATVMHDARYLENLLIPSLGHVIELDEENAKRYEALYQALRNPDAKVVIRKEEEPEGYKPPRNRFSFEQGKKGYQGRQQRYKRTDQKTGKRKKSNIKVSNLSYSVTADESHYGVYVELDGELVRVGWIPQAGRLVDQAEDIQDRMFGDEETKAKAEQRAGELGEAFRNDAMHMFHKLEHADNVADVRNWLATQEGDVELASPFVRDTRQGKSLDGSPIRGNLLRPSHNSSVKIGERAEVLDAIQEHGIAVMLRDKNGEGYLQVIGIDGSNLGRSARPYQDGLIWEGQNYMGTELGHAFGSFFIPIIDPNSTGSKVMWVRVDHPSVGAMGVADNIRNVLEKAGDQKYDPEATLAELGKYTKIVTGKGEISDDFSGFAIIDDLVTMVHRGQPTGVWIKSDGQLEVVDDRDFAQIGELPFAIEVREDENGKFFNWGAKSLGQKGSKLDMFTAAVRMPVAEVRRKEDGKLLGYHNPLPGPRTADYQENPLNGFWPELQKTQLPPTIDFSKVAERPDPDVEVVEDGERTNPAAKRTNAPVPKGSQVKFLTTERASASGENTKATKQDQKEADEWLAANLPHIQTKRVADMIRRGGIQGYGIWEQGMITISDLAVRGTEYHEAFHAVMDVYLTPSRKARLFKEARKKYGDLGLIELEEKMAEAFREFILSKGKSMREGSLIRRIYNELIDLIRGYQRGEFHLRRLMHQINRGKFTYKPDSRTRNFMTKWMKAPPFSPIEMEHLSGIMPIMLNNVYDQVHEIYSMTDEETKEYLEDLYPTTEGDPYKGLRETLVKIKSEIKSLTQEEDDNDTQDSPRAIKKRVVSLALEAIFHPFGTFTGIMQVSLHDDAQRQETLDRVQASREHLVDHFSDLDSIRSLIFESLKVDSVTGTTAFEQYGGMSLAEIDPKSKVPASIKNLISRTAMIPAELSGELMKLAAQKNNIEAVLAEAQRIDELSMAERIDRHNPFGLPNMMRFDHVYTYLLHHLSNEPTYSAMEAEMIRLARFQPSIAMLVMKLRANETLQQQFFVAMKRAKTSEINVVTDIPKRDPQDPTDAKPIDLVKDSEPTNPLSRLTNANFGQVMLNLKNMGEATALIKKLEAMKEDGFSIDAALEVLDMLGIRTFTPGARVTALTTMTSEQKNVFASDILGLIKAAKRYIDNPSEDTMRTPYAKLITLLGGNQGSGLGSFVAADFGAAASRFPNHEGKYIYSYMAPSFATEEIDRLTHSSASKHVAYRIKQDPRLADTLWEHMAQNAKLKYARFGGLNGKSYDRMSQGERFNYDLVTTLQGWTAIPTPSDADNSMLVSNIFLSLTPDQQDFLLKKIFEVEVENASKNPKHTTLPGILEVEPGKEVEFMRDYFLREAQVIMGIPELAAAATKVAKQRGVKNTIDLVKRHAMATYVSNWNVSHWLGGSFPEFKDIGDFQKRFKHILSPGMASADMGTFRSVTIEDPVAFEAWYVDDKGNQKPIERADGASYVTVEFYERMLRAHGEVTPAMERVFEKIKNGEKLTGNEIYTLKPYKPFYFGWLGSTPHQIKNSVVPIIPQQASPSMKALHEWMTDKTKPEGEIHQVTLKSAHKIGPKASEVAKGLFDENGQFVKPTEPVHVYDLPMKNHRNQVHINEHFEHFGTVGFATQTPKIITGNLLQYDTILHRGKELTGKKMRELLLAKEANMLEAKLNALKHKFYVKDDNGKPTNIPDHDKIRKYALDNLRDDVHPAVLEELKKTGKNINSPLLMTVLDQVLKSSMQKDFKKAQVAGGLQVQISDLGHLGPDGTPLKGMRVEDGVGKPAQVKTSRKYLPPKYRNMSIEEIKKVAPEVLEVVVYRVPSEAKNSMAVVEIVEFLPEGQDGMIIPAALVAQMGSDFDIDKLFVNWEFSAKEGKQLTRFQREFNEYQALVKSILLDPQVLQKEVLVEQGFETLKAFRTKMMAQDPSRRIKDEAGQQTTIDKYIKNRPYSALSHLQLTADNLAGISLKGISSLNNTFFLNMQRYGAIFPINEDSKVYLTTEFNGERVPAELLNINAQSVAASMDGAKDPVWGQMGIDVKNFLFFMEGVAIKMAQGKSLDAAMQEQWTIATNPRVRQLMDIPTSQLQAEIDAMEDLTPEETAAIEDYMDYRKYLQPVIAEAREIVRSQEIKLQNIDSLINTGMMANERFGTDTPMIGMNVPGKSLVDAHGVGGHLDIGLATRDVLIAMGLDYYTKLGDYGKYTTFDMFIRHEVMASAENYTNGDLKILGIRNKNESRPAIDLTEPSQWNMEDWLYFFELPEGKEFLAKNDALRIVHQHVALGKEYSDGDLRYINMTLVGLNDPILGETFRVNLDTIFSDERSDMEYNGTSISKDFANALVRYEAARSGWRYGSNTLTRYLPSDVMLTAEGTGSVPDEVAVKVAEALGNRAPEVGGKDSSQKRRNAYMGNRTVSFVDKGVRKIFFTVGDGLTRRRTYITLRSYDQLRGSLGTETLSNKVREALNNFGEVSSVVEEFKSKNQSRRTYGGTETKLQERIVLLENKFARYGVNVKVVLDPSLPVAGDVVWDQDKGTVRLNPARLGSDTLIHEFAHIYIEGLGYDHPLVQEAIRQLKKTPLYEQVKADYPDYSQRDLEMETLATAMGMEGDQIFDEAIGKDSNRIRTIIRKVLRALGKIFGIERNVARDLVRDMLEGHNLNVAVHKYQFQQRLAKNLNEVDLMKAVSDELAERISHMRRLGMTPTEEFDLIQKFQDSKKRIGGAVSKAQGAGLEILTDEIKSMLGDVTNFLSFAPSYLTKMANSPSFTDKDAQFFNLAYQLMQIINTYSQALDSFDQFDINPVTGKSFQDPVLQEKLIALQALDTNLNQALKQLDRVVVKALNDKMIANGSNPELAELTTDVFHLARTENAHLVTDTSWLSKTTMGIKEQDSNIILQLFAQVMNRVINGEEINAKQDVERVQNRIDEFQKSGNKLEDLINEEGNAFISPILEKFYKARAASPNKARWEAANLEQEYTKEYYLNVVLAPSSATITALEEERTKYRLAKEQGTLTESEALRLAAIEEDLSSLKQNNRTWFIYHDVEYDTEGWKRDRDSAKQEGDAVLRAFDKTNSRFTRGRYVPGRPYQTSFKVKDKYKNPNWTGTVQPIAKWRNPAFDQLSQEQKDMIEFLVGSMRDAYGGEAKFFDRALLPQMAKPTGRTLKEIFKETIQNAKDATSASESQERQDSLGNRVFTRPPISAMVQKEGTISTDLRATISDFITEARARQAQNTIETFALMTRDQMMNMEMVKDPSRNDKLVAIIGGKRKKEAGIVMGRQSHSLETLEHVLEGMLGSGWTNQGAAEKMMKGVMQYTSFMGIGLNISAWTNNVLYGSVQQRMETMGGNSWQPKQMRKARRMVWAHILDIVSSRAKRSSPRSALSAILHTFDVTIDQRELPHDITHLKRLYDFAFIGQTVGELLMQSQVLVAMLMNTEVILANGTRQSFYETLEKSWTGGRTVSLPAGARIVKRDGTINDLNNQEMGAYKNMVLSKLQHIHGAYNVEDLGTMHRHAVGQMLLQFRKWVPLAMKRRYGKERYNEAREEAEIGWYNALWHKVIKPVLTPGGDNFLRFLAQYKSFENQPHIQRAAKKAVYEIMLGYAAFGAVILLESLVKVDDDDDEEFFLVNDEFYKAKLLYHASRLNMEINQYTLTGFHDFATKFGQDPAASIRQIKTFGKFMYQMYLGVNPFREMETFKGGVNYGDLKWKNYGLRLIPGVKHYYALADTIKDHDVYSFSKRPGS